MRHTKAAPTKRSAEEDPGRPHGGREIPWLRVVRFHKDIVARAEEGFFSLNGRDDQGERWSSLSAFEPIDLGGPWNIAEEGIRSRPFRLALAQGQHESLFLGGPCFLGWTRPTRGDWLPQWRPLLYREVSVIRTDERLEIQPQQGSWSLTPLLYGLLERMEVNVGSSFDEFAAAIIEVAAGYLEAEDEPLDRRILRALFSRIPDAEKEFSKKMRPGDFAVRPTPWVLFAPTGNFAAMIRHLMLDYERLESLLDSKDAHIGGLRLLEDQQVQENERETHVLPVVPLNTSQQQAVQRILECRPVTLISGPPGTGKSQVVVSLLLNAWAQGRTVLFASNNNKAVDVVRERVTRFESEFPIAVRAGAKQKQNVQEVLHRTLFMANRAKHMAQPDGTVHVAQKREQLLRGQKALLKMLSSRLPQRIDELWKTALQAYGESRSALAALQVQEKALLADEAALGFGSQPVSEVVAALEETREWLQRIEYYRSLVEQDGKRRTQLRQEVLRHERVRNRAVEDVGLPSEDVDDWGWLLSGPSAALLADWEQRYRALLAEPLEQALEPFDWREDYARWRSADHAAEWATQSRAFSETVRRTCAELAPKLQEIQKLSTAIDASRNEIEQLGLPEEIDLPLDALADWTAAFAESATREPAFLDFLPWSSSANLHRQLKRLEQRLRLGLPLGVLTQIGALTAEGRLNFAPVVEASRKWLELRRRWAEAQTTIQEVESRFSDLRDEAASLRLIDTPERNDAEAWTPMIGQCDETAYLADEAAVAWRRRADKEEAERTLIAMAKEWARFGSGIPLNEAWRHGQGKGFDEAVRSLEDHPDTSTLALARKMVHAGKLPFLVERWRSAAESEERACNLRQELISVPTLADRVSMWWGERPSRAFVLPAGDQSAWPDTGEAEALVGAVAAWCARRKSFLVETRPSTLQQASDESKRAVSKLEQAIEAMPATQVRTQVTDVLSSIRRAPEQDWPIADLNKAFAEFSPARIRSRLAQIEAELERGSFADAKGRWLERLRNDDEAVRAVDALEKSLRQNKGPVVESQYRNFRTALRLVPVWITTAQASQAIPLVPELFDIVVIDEASQCTLTNLLPLMYRGRTLAVIGDENQLPAIPTIQQSEELALAQKHGVEEHLALIGHATNDVYKAAAESLPRRRADVLMLDEHFRSHPQIIGFSNRYIYLQRLKLKKDPSWEQRLPIASGVHSVPVMGSARRGENGRSWVNLPEAEAVLKQIEQLKQGDTRSLSLGVVTPFAAQKDLLRERLSEMGMATDVLVDTAHGFQGDEYDIILFSPVVAKGMSSPACHWVESPPNLINVAVTRAREALFVIADFDYCLQQQGILRQLAMYCKDVQLLRDTSPAELELFSWMVVNGWEPRVHARIGDTQVDFLLESQSGPRLAIEVDSRQHHEGTPEQDKARDAFLMARGYEVLRVPAREVLETPFDVVHQIETKLQAEAALE